MTEQQPNVYAPPTAAERTPSAISGLMRVRVPIPPAVIGAAWITGLYAVSSVISGLSALSPGGLAQAMVSILILVGIVRGSALAWQWGRLVPIITAISSAVGLILFAMNAEESALHAVVTLYFVILGSVALTIMLSIKSSKRYFGLACPHCGSLRSKADNFLFTAYRCRDCNSTWR